ncbi:hypothetical protein SKAU_G00078160 [Synaphobranchus kaupii]|uniref:Uncharacterized protein n=1 Tax=Synaphobranchus kaupii TaxID=118154 RepID=A0A9Q1J5B9_SYNKA|nr:hypothetical protein SKAU_G00078160 [Synaphobranchus kaupii]
MLHKPIGVNVGLAGISVSGTRSCPLPEFSFILPARRPSSPPPASVRTLVALNTCPAGCSSSLRRGRGVSGREGLIFPPCVPVFVGRGRSKREGRGGWSAASFELQTRGHMTGINMAARSLISSRISILGSEIFNVAVLGEHTGLSAPHAPSIRVSERGHSEIIPAQYMEAREHC